MCVSCQGHHGFLAGRGECGRCRQETKLNPQRNQFMSALQSAVNELICKRACGLWENSLGLYFYFIGNLKQLSTSKTTF